MNITISILNLWKWRKLVSGLLHSSLFKGIRWTKRSIYSERYNLEVGWNGSSVGWSSNDSSGRSESSDSSVGTGSVGIVERWTAGSGVKELGRSHSDEGKNDNDLEHFKIPTVSYIIFVWCLPMNKLTETYVFHHFGFGWGSDLKSRIRNESWCKVWKCELMLISLFFWS